MSVDLDVLPTIHGGARWGDVKSRWMQYVSPSDRVLLGPSPQMARVRFHTVVSDDYRFIDDWYCYFKLALRNTLGLCIHWNRESFNLEKMRPYETSERQYVEDYGRNLDRESIELVTQLWCAAGYRYNVETMGGRTADEPRLFVALAAAVADACKGYVVVLDDLYDIAPGIYDGETFRHVRPKFR